MRVPAIILLTALTAVAAGTRCTTDGASDSTPASTGVIATGSTDPSTANDLTVRTDDDRATGSPVTTTEPEIEIPGGVLVVVPTQNREDPPKHQFQLQFVNGTRERFEVAGVRFRWSGFTTPFSPRDSIIVGGQTIDFPVPFPGATCVGDGTIDEMPDPTAATVELTLKDGSVRDVAVVDKWHLVRKLYLEDCVRQHIDREVTIEWVGLHREEFEGRPVTAGRLRLTRRAAEGAVAVVAMSDTIPYVVRPLRTSPPIVALPPGQDVAEAPVRFIESRCDPHALAEVKQPHEFIGQIDLGDGLLRPYVVEPDESWWVPMRRIADEACAALGKIEFPGDERRGEP